MTFGEIAFPLVSVWSIAAYIHTLHLFYIFEKVTSKLFLYSLFLPVIALEFYFSLHFPLGSPHTMINITIAWTVLFLLRVLYWFLFFMIWVIFMGFTARHSVVIKFFISEFHFQFYLLYRAEKWFTFLAFILWIFSYYLLTIKADTLRIFTGMVLPGSLTFALLYHLYHFGGIGGLKKGRILRQRALKRVFQLREIGSHIIPQHPRGIYHDRNRNVLFVMFGATYGKRKAYPTIVRIDLKSNIKHAFLSRNIRRICFDEKTRTIFVAPWYEDTFFKLSMDELKIIGNWTNQTKDILQTWEPMDVIKDVKEDRIYIGNDADQAVVSYHSETGKIIKVLDLVAEKAVRAGGPVWNIRQSQKTRKLYFISGPGAHLFEVDPDSLTILRKKRLFEVVGTALELDDENNLLYYQNGSINALYEIDVRTFEILRTFKGECHARRIRLDKKRNCIYVLGYLSGTLFPIDLNFGKRAWTIHVGGLPHGMDLYENSLWINSMSGVLKIDLPLIWKEKQYEEQKTSATSP